MTVGRFLIDALKRKNTLYGITDNRIIIKSGIFSKGIKSVTIKAIPELSFKEKKDGTGTITLGPDRYAQLVDRSNIGRLVGPRLVMIKDVRRVYGIILAQRAKI